MNWSELISNILVFVDNIFYYSTLKYYVNKKVDLFF